MSEENQQRTKLSEKKRSTVIHRDEFECQECGVDVTNQGVTPHVHHIIADNAGGSDDLENLETLCGECHRETDSWGRPFESEPSYWEKSDDGLVINPTDNAILNRLREGRASPSYIAEKEDYSRQNVTNRLGRLVEHGHVEKLAPGLYELRDDPRDNQ